MIISASRRTDIPAFYSKWFINRIKAGYFFKVNPFNPKQVKGISLAAEDVDVIVFWTKNPQPILKYISELNKRGYKYYFQYTLNAYPEVFEPYLPDLRKRIEVFKELSEKTNRKQVIWRYDPIIYSNITPIKFHLDKFEEIASQIHNYTTRVVISFLDIYGKIKKRLNKLEKNKSIKVKDIVEYEEELLYISRELKNIADKYGLEIRSCGETDNFSADIIKPGSCIDKDLINQVFDLKLDLKKDKNQREQCLCVSSVDMGIYDTCKFSCIYCYGNNSMNAVKNKIKDHNPESSILIGECKEKYFIRESLFF